MTTDIWMPLYISDYLRDTMHLTDAQHGAYLLLLMCCWSADGVLPDSDEQFAAICRCSLDSWRKHRPILSKFFDVSDGVWTHQRVVQERLRAKHLQEVRASAGRKGGSKTKANRVANPQQKGTPSPSPSHIAEREPDFPECNGHPTLKEVLAKAQFMGLAEWKASDWFHEMQGCGWKDHHNRDVMDWVSVLTRVKVKWESDGRPKGPPITKGTQARPEVKASSDSNSLQMQMVRDALKHPNL